MFFRNLNFLYLVLNIFIIVLFCSSLELMFGFWGFYNCLKEIKELYMYRLKLRETRGKTITDCINSAHTFSFAQYFDPFNMGFSDLRVINDDILTPCGEFSKRKQSNMEIVDFILEGEMEYKDSLGNTEILSKGDIQTITTGSGITYSERNFSLDNHLHFLQLWILPNKKNLEPSYGKKNFSKEKMMNELCLVISGEGKHHSLKINQDMKIYKSILQVDKTINYQMPENRKFWIQVLKGAIEINSNILEAGDGVSIVNESGTMEITGVDFESMFLLIDLRNLSI